SPNKVEDSLSPSLTNTYTRITFANKAKTERCTIDINLSYKGINAPVDKVAVDDIAIIEIKQSRVSLLGGVMSSLRKMQIYPISFSKYVFGTIQLYPNIKHNLFKPLLYKVDKIRTQEHRAVS